MEAEDIMTTRIKLRRDTAANWFDANPILSAGEPGLETDTRQIKYGDGVTAWRELEYAGTNIKSMGPVTVATQDPHIWVNKLGKPKNNMYATNLAYDSQGNLVVVSTAIGGITGVDTGPVMNVTKFDPEGNTLWSKDVPGEYTTISGGVAIDMDDNIFFSLTNTNESRFTTVTKLATDGTVLWQESFGGNDTSCTAMAVGPDGNPVVTGQTFTPGTGTYSSYIAKLNGGNGAVLHSKSFGTINDESSNGVAVDANNNVVIVGCTYDNVKYANVVTLHKTNPNLSEIWSKEIATVQENFNDGYLNMGGADVTIDAVGNIYLAGWFTAYRREFGNSSQTNVVVMKLNSDGVVSWSRDIRGECDSAGTGIALGPDGRIYVSAFTYKKAYLISNMPAQSPIETVLMASYEPASGECLWQRYFETPERSSNAPGWNEGNVSYQYLTGSNISVYGNKIALSGALQILGINPFSNDYWYGDEQAWVAQLPTSGEPVNISGWKFVESRIPARFQSFASETVSFTESTDLLDSGTGGPVDIIDSVVAITQIMQESNTWKFGDNGDLTLPPSGDLNIGKKQVGWVNLFGYQYNTNSSVRFEGVCVDPMGNSYAYGYDQRDDNPIVVKYNTDGVIEWQKLMFYGPIVNDNYTYGTVESAAYYNGQLVVTVTDYDNGRTLLVTLNAMTGDTVSSQSLTMGAREFDTWDVQLKSDGTPVAVGVVNTGVKNFDVVVLRGGIDDYNYSWFEMSTSLFGSDVPMYNQQGEWLVQGTGIDGEQYCQFINRYEPIVATPVPGTGATFDVTVASTAYSAVAVNAGGTGYKAGDAVVIPGNLLGGATPANDLYVSIDTVSTGAVATASIISGTAAGADTTYTGVAGATETGNDAIWFVDKYDDSGATYDAGTNNAGTNYRAGDVLKILGSVLGGVDGTNDLTITVVAVDGSGSITSSSIAGTPSLATTRFRFDISPQVNFGGAGSWKIGVQQSGDAVIWTPAWQHQFGTTGADFATSVAIDNSDNIIVGGNTYINTYFGGGSPVSWISKFNSAGALQWTINLLEDGGAAQYQPHVAVDSEGNIIVSLENDNLGREIWKFKPDGTFLWQVRPDQVGIFFPYDGSIGIDADDNIIVAGEDDWSQWFITKLDTDGNIQFNNRIAVGQGMYQQNENNGTRWTAVVGDHFWTAGTTEAFAGENRNGFVAKLPIDGSGLDGVNGFAYSEVQVPVVRNGSVTIVGNWSTSVFSIHASEGITSTTASPPIITVPEVSYDTYQSPVFDQQGGAIVFGDGTRQDTAAGVLTQRVLNSYYSGYQWGSAYNIGLSDAGRHILLSGNQDVFLPSAGIVDFPVGTVLTIVNWSGSTRYVYYASGNTFNPGGQQTYLNISGGASDYYNSYLAIPSYSGGNIVTLLKIAEIDDAQQGGSTGYRSSTWIASGSGLYFTD